MRTEVATALVVDTNGAVSQPIATNGLNGVRADMAVIAVSGTPTVNATVEESNDLQNWSAALLTLTLTTGFPAFTVNTTSGASSMARMTYVRLKLSVSASSACITAGLDLYKFVT
jgi:hypothetical protein